MMHYGISAAIQNDGGSSTGSTPKQIVFHVPNDVTVCIKTNAAGLDGHVSDLLNNIL